MRNVIVQHRNRAIHPMIMLKPHQKAMAKEIVRELEASGIEMIEDRNADFECGWEEMMRTHAGLRTFDPERTWLRRLDGSMGTESHFLGTRRASAAETADAFVYGPGEESIYQGHKPASAQFAYWAYETFRHHAKRKFAVAGFTPDAEDALDVTTVAADLVDSEAQIFIKPTDSKALPATVATLTEYQGEPLLSFDHPAWDWAPVSQEGRRDVALVQQKITMRYEYRVFVVGGQIVTGAGAVEHLTPFDRDQTRNPAFDDRLCEYRGRSEVTTELGITARLISFAGSIVEEFLEETDGALDTYVIDVALDAEDAPLIVELNEISTAGFFAADPYRVAEAFRSTLH